MDEFGFVGVAEQALDLRRRLAGDEAGFGGGIVGKPAGDLGAGGRAHGNHIPTGELPSHLHHPDGQQALAAVAQFVHRACIDGHRAAHLQVIDHPLLARRQFRQVWVQVGADGFPTGQSQQHVRLPAPGNDGGSTTARGPLGRQDLGDHAAAPEG